VEDLSAFFGEDCKGDWTLKVSDNAGSDTGTVNQWKLQLYGPDTSPPTAIADLEAALSEDKVSLSWSPASDDVSVSYYVIYRSADPTFQPQASDSIGWTMGTTFLDQDSPVGNAGINSYYAVKAVDVAGNKSMGSNKVGEFDKELDGGSKKHKKKMRMSYHRG
jgi:hypothetical protein